MKKMNVQRIVMWIFAIIPNILVASVYSKLPNQIITSWGINGVVSYSNRNTLWIMANIPVIIAMLFVLLPKIDPKEQNYLKFNNEYYGFAVAIIIFLLGMISIIILKAFNMNTVEVPNVVCFCLAILLAVIGSILPKVESNFFIGIKNPWTISNDKVWEKTHKFAGKLWIFGSLILALISIFLKENMLVRVFVPGILVLAIVPNIMSYIWYKNRKK